MVKTIHKLILGSILMVCFITASNAQESPYFKDIPYTYHQGDDHYEDRLHGQSIVTFETFLSTAPTIDESNYQSAQYYDALSKARIAALDLELPEAESDLIATIDKHSSNPIFRDAIYELANYYYNEKLYANAIEYFDKIDIDALPEIEMSELAFKKGYCHFVKQEFDQAQYSFSYSKDIQNRFFYPINYYYGMCEYFSRDYEGAIKSFERVENNTVYKPHIPYYLAQIHFAKKNYDRLISYGERVIADPNTKKKTEIRLLLGQAYFIRNDYERALPHLEHYEANTPSLTIEEFYQLAFTQYQLGYCEKALENFLEIYLEDSKLGQVVNYYMADCYEKLNDLASARAAFKKVSQMNYDASMKEEATFNYGKLSAEMEFEREAINVLVGIDQQSPYYKETQEIINNILVNTSDYENAISIMESLPSLNKSLERTYQSVTFKRALQFLDQGDFKSAKTYFAKSYQYPLDQNLITQAYFWEGFMYAERDNYKESADMLYKYFSLTENVGPLPAESSPPIANYYLAYNFLKTERFDRAATKFKEAIIGINKDKEIYDNVIITKRILPDAYLRAGDCLFKQRKYDAAVTYYDQSIERDEPGHIYALYQRGIIEGLLQEPYQKILTMEKLADNYPESEFADDALVQLGDTYLALGSPIPAAVAFRRIIDDYKGRTNLMNAANLKLGLINYNEGDIEGALAYYKNVFRFNPNPQESQEALLAIEEIYIDDLGKTDEYFNFLKTVPGYEISAFEKDSLNFRIAEVQYQNSNYEKAISGYNEYLKKFDQGYYKLDALYGRAESQSILKRYDGALKDYETIIEAGYSDYYERSLKKAALISYNHSQKFQKAFRYYQLLEQQTQSNEDQFLAQWGSLQSAFRISNDNAVSNYANLIINNPLGTNDEKSSAYFYLAKVSYKTKQYEQAKAAFSNVASLSNNNQAAESRYMIAQILFDNGEMEAAENAASNANNANANYPFWIAKTILLMSDIYIKKDDLLNARAGVEAVLENFKSDNKLVDQANKKLSEIKALEDAKSRIKIENSDGTLELDTTGN